MCVCLPHIRKRMTCQGDLKKLLLTEGFGRTETLCMRIECSVGFLSGRPALVLVVCLIHDLLTENSFLGER